MEMFAIANQNCIDCYYDFELNTWGDGLCSNNLLPTEKVAEMMVDILELGDGEIIEVVVEEVTKGEDGYVDYHFEDIWHDSRTNH